MLKYKINIKNEKNEYKEVKYDSLCLSYNGLYLTGITDASYGLQGEKQILVVSNDTHICSLSATDVTYGGYVLYNQEYVIEENYDGIGIYYVDGIFYNVDKNAFSNQQIENGGEEIINPFLTIDDKKYEIGVYENGEVIWKDSVIIPTKYLVLNNQITINDIVYDLIYDEKNDLNNDNESYPYIILNGDGV